MHLFKILKIIDKKDWNNYILKYISFMLGNLKYLKFEQFMNLEVKIKKLDQIYMNYIEPVVYLKMKLVK